MKKLITTLFFIGLLTVDLTGQSNFDMFSKSALKDYLTEEQFSGAVLAINSKGDKISLSNGYADALDTEFIGVKAKFKIASITKLFTSVIIMQLIDEGKTTLETTIEEIIPDSGITNAKKINLKNLMQHTSGLKNESQISYLNNYSADRLISTFATKKASFKPGKDLNYNNVDFIILGKIIEQLTEKSYLENLNERIVKRLNMDNTGLLVEKELPVDITPAYEIKKSSKKPDLKIHIENFWAAGSMYSTVEDLLKFTQALKSEELLSLEAKQKLFKSAPSLGYAALGCWTFNSPFIPSSPRVLERRGGILGATSVIMTSLDGPETLIVLSNTTGFNPDTFGQADNMKEYLFKQLFANNH